MERRESENRLCHRGRSYALWLGHAVFFLLLVFVVGGSLVAGLLLIPALLSLPLLAPQVLLFWLRKQCWVSLDSAEGVLTVKNVSSRQVQVHLSEATFSSTWLTGQLPELQTPNGRVPLWALSRQYSTFGGDDPAVAALLQTLERMTGPTNPEG